LHADQSTVRYGQAFQRKTLAESLTGNRVSTGMAALWEA
jgi:hypothetical protein